MKFLAVLLSLVSLSVLGLPSFDEVKKAHRKSDAAILDRHGRMIHEKRVDAHGRRLDWTPLSELSAALTQAILVTEDKRFYQHGGVDWRAVLSSIVSRLYSARMRGASTISMQLAAQLEPSLKKRGRRGFLLKWRQMQGARELEDHWTKDQIFEAYVNLVSFRGELRGVAAASRGLLGKEPHGISVVESAVLAALIKGPNASADEVERRACRLAGVLGPKPTCDEITRVVDTALRSPHFVQPRLRLAPHVASLVAASNAPTDGNAVSGIVTTLDGGLQRFAIDSLKQHLLALSAQNVRDGAVLVVDNESGDVLSYVGNAGELSSQYFVDAVRASRQAGSTLKPFLYALAFERKLLTPASLVDDSPLDVSVTHGIYRPGNYDNRFYGLVTARVALASSLNIPAVKTLLLVGYDAFLEKLRGVGLGVSDTDNYYGPSIALGTADVSLWDLVNAYRTLANGGRYSPIGVRPHRERGLEKRVYSEGSAYLVSDILSDREARSLTFGLESPLATRFWTAVKTGTSKDMRDNWCIGYSSHYTVGVWVGNFSGAPMWNVSGTSGAAPVWIDVMNYLHRDFKSRAPKLPREVKVASVQINSRARKETFISGTESNEVRPVERRTRQRILYPTSGTLFALDPDIPPDAQRLLFEAQSGEASLRWTLNGEELSPVPAANVSWNPRPGRYTLAIVDEQNLVIDSVKFEVRPSAE